ncbi:MAG: (d)CMP kinase [Bacteroidales bacterium]|nr:(d)CMP kinase [Anaerotignum sp.]MCI5680242.1 (d)CMP kinase [Bacteroidales bacterium]MDY3926030.1 (d)CMP kinase [Anaerotignum sp.]
MKRFAIAVDGPAGSGKSTVAKMVARKLGIIYVDTGAMYRTVALHCTQENIPLEEEAAVVAALDGLNMRIQPDTEGQRIFLNEEDVTAKIRTAEIGKGASVVAAYQKVRERMVELQQEMAREQSVIMDGRDIGTVVLPHAEVKIYLDAGVEERARRRVGELEAKGETADFEEIKKMIIQRDYNDMHREHSPLKKAEDAISLDSTGMSIEEVLQAILDITAERVKEK